MFSTSSNSISSTRHRTHRRRNPPTVVRDLSLKSETGTALSRCNVQKERTIGAMDIFAKDSTVFPCDLLNSFTAFGARTPVERYANAFTRAHDERCTRSSMRPSLRENHPLIVDRSTDASFVDPIHVSQTVFPLRAAQHLILSLASELRDTIVRVERR